MAVNSTVNYPICATPSPNHKLIKSCPLEVVAFHARTVRTDDNVVLTDGWDHFGAGKAVIPCNGRVSEWSFPVRESEVFEEELAAFGINPDTQFDLQQIVFPAERRHQSAPQYRPKLMEYALLSGTRACRQAELFQVGQLSGIIDLAISMTFVPCSCFPPSTRPVGTFA